MLHIRLFALSILFIACSNSEPPPDPSDPSDPAAACSAYARTLCERREACGAPMLEGWFGTRARCEAYETATCETRQTAPGSGLTASALDACRADLTAATCVTVLDPELARCDPRGTLAVGAACLDHEQCAGGDCWRELNSDVCGECRDLGGAGAACSPDPDEGESCAAGLVCIDGTCEAGAISLAGETCEPSTLRRCALALFCNARFVCEPQVGFDAPCTELLSECDFAQRLFCDPEVKRCRTIPISTDGSCIPIGAPGGAACPPGFYCTFGDFACQPFLEEGAACTDVECGPGLGCVRGTCVAEGDLTCAGGDIEPPPGPAPTPFVFDVPPGGVALELDCAAATATLAYSARYKNSVDVAIDVSVDGSAVTIGTQTLAFTVAPATSTIEPSSSRAVRHAGNRAIPPGTCDVCGQTGELVVNVTTSLLGSLAYTTAVTATCVDTPAKESAAPGTKLP